MLRHRKLKNQWLLIPILIMLILLSGSFLLKKHNYRVIVDESVNHQPQQHIFQQKHLQQQQQYYFKTTSSSRTTTEASLLSLAPARYVTKSLAELGKMDEINKHVLFVNQVPYCGAEIVIFLLQKLQGFNNYRHVRLKGDTSIKLSKLQQEEFVDNFYDVIRNKAVPLSFDRQIYFINFTIFDKQSPTFINIIRDPTDKLLSRSFYKNKNKETYDKNDLIHCLKQENVKCELNINVDDLTIPYFCGHDSRCLTHPEWSLQVAKENVEKYYPVVGVLEELNATLEVLEHKIPFFFKGVQNLYQKNMIDKFNQKKDSHKKHQFSKTKVKQLNQMLVQEYEFYGWVKSRLFQQLQILYGDHNSQH